MKKKNTVDLVPGDVVDWGDHMDKILSVTIEKGEKSVRVDTERTFSHGLQCIPVPCFFNAGIKSVQDIVEFCPGCGSMDTDTNPVEGGECPVCICRRAQATSVCHQ